MSEEPRDELVFKVPKRKFYISGVVFIASVFTFFISVLVVFQLLFVFPEPKRMANGLKETYIAFVGVAFVTLVASGVYLRLLLSRDADPK